MTTVILLSANDAAAVRGPSAETPAAALDPRPLTDGRYILPAAVLSDTLHVEDWPRLGALPQADLSTIAHLLPPEPVL